MTKLTKTSATLDELILRRDELKQSIKQQQNEVKTIVGTIKQFQKLIASEPAQPARRSRKKSASAAASS
jgi:hypothetical protein